MDKIVDLKCKVDSLMDDIDILISGIANIRIMNENNDIIGDALKHARFQK